MTSDVTSQLGVPMLDNTPTQVTGCRGDPALDTGEEVELSSPRLGWSLQEPFLLF